MSYEQSNISDPLRILLNAVTSDSENLRLLQTDPDALGRKYNLSTDELQALRLADVLIHINPRRPAGGGTTTSLTFDTGSTIVAGVIHSQMDITFQTGTTITASRVRDVLADILRESPLLDRLRSDPGSVLEELGIARDQLDRVQNAKLGVNMRPITFTFATGTTIQA